MTTGVETPHASTPPVRPGGRSFAGREIRPAELLEKYAGVLVLVAIVAVFGLLKPSEFLAWDNIVSILGNGGTTGIIALGLVLPLAAGVFDISVAGAMTCSVIGVTYFFETTGGSMPIPVSMLIVIAGAVVVGCINAALVLRLSIDPFIATIGTGSLLIGFSQALSNGSIITEGIPDGFTTFGRASLGKIPMTVLVFLGLALILWYILAHTPFGRHLYATGASREATRLAGIHTSRIVTLAFVGSAIGAAIAGIMVAARLGSGTPSVGDNYLLPAYSTAFLGATMITPGRFNVIGLIVATLILGAGVNGLQLVGVPFWVVPLFQGTALLIAVGLGRVRGAGSGA